VNPVSRARGRPALWITLCLILVLSLAACAERGSVEEQVRARIDAMEAAGEAGERGAFMGMVAEGFEAQDGAMTREDFSRYLLLQLNQRRRVQAQVFPVVVEARGTNLADARFKLLLTGGQGLIPEEGRLLDVETSWVLEGGDWLLWRAHWRDAAP